MLYWKMFITKVMNIVSNVQLKFLSKPQNIYGSL